MIETFTPDTARHNPDGWLSKKVALRRDRAFGMLQQARGKANSSLTSINGNLPTLETDGSGKPKQANLGIYKGKPGAFSVGSGKRISTHNMTARDLAEKNAGQNIIDSSEPMTRNKKKATKDHAADARAALKKHDKMATRYNRYNRLVGVLTGAVAVEAVAGSQDSLVTTQQHPEGPVAQRPLADGLDDNNPALQRLLSRGPSPGSTPMTIPSSKTQDPATINRTQRPTII